MSDKVIVESPSGERSEIVKPQGLNYWYLGKGIPDDHKPAGFETIQKAIKAVKKII